ncbi:protein kinase [Nannocystis sp. RBIL2]|uniref:serine/threonine-protein kinase n=1 Tax=Nannocystis sp. RBIL2 TaxID=2996788 RepID=UPI002270BB4C|nr:serine/threonine protein kinase [Nannocystis sp. RBIL2]MCY1070616.1 protein kinase [Nannocystis sp. RBIL2]
MQEPALIGSVLDGRYKILDRLGAGGMGAVYRAEHVMLGSQVAIKVLLPKFAHDSEWVRRFLLEARAASRLRHPHIVQVHDLAAPHQGLVYMVMELLEGESLHALSRREGPLPWQRVARLSEQVADALAAAHARGIIHRDIKPPNVFRIGGANDPDFVKVLDFGIAKFLADASGDGEGPHTASDILMGTPEYIAPELIEGSRPDARADVYSLGVMMYKLLTGRVPFVGNHIVVAYQIRNGPPAPPSRHLPPGVVPPEVDTLILRAIRREREERTASMTELIAALRACRDIQPVAPDPLATTDLQAALSAAAAPTRVTLQPVAPERARPDIVEPPPIEHDLSEESTLRRDKSLPAEPITDVKAAAQSSVVAEVQTDRTSLPERASIPEAPPRSPVRSRVAVAASVAFFAALTTTVMRWGRSDDSAGSGALADDGPPPLMIASSPTSVSAPQPITTTMTEPAEAPPKAPEPVPPPSTEPVATTSTEPAETLLKTAEPTPPPPSEPVAAPPAPVDPVRPKSGPSTRKRRSGGSATEVNLSQSLSSAAIVRYLEAMDAKIQKDCFQAHNVLAETTVQVAVSVDPSGQARVKPNKPRSWPSVACIVKLVEKYTFPQTQQGGTGEHVFTAQGK